MTRVPAPYTVRLIDRMRLVDDMLCYVPLASSTPVRGCTCTTVEGTRTAQESSSTVQHSIEKYLLPSILAVKDRRIHEYCHNYGRQQHWLVLSQGKLTITLQGNARLLNKETLSQLMVCHNPLNSQNICAIFQFSKLTSNELSIALLSHHSANMSC